MALRVPQRAPVSEVDDLWIPLPDGGRLSAHLWLPPGADAAPVPAIVEVSPYRHEDHTRRRDAVRHPYFAEHGYASLRVDIRGSGASSGVLLDEYTEQEQEDVCAALEWVAAQTWCTGSLGMIGLSWGGFAALQAAARRPAALKAVVAVCASADRYGADVKYHGGCVLGCELLPWSSTMLAMSVRPPDPDLVGEGWRELWLERLEQAVPFAETWLAHQRRDEYWHTGSPSDDYASVECPVYAVGGWADPYRQAVLDLLASLSCPRKGLIGPWAHQYPEEGTPGPAFDFRAECVRWWDHWLKGEPTGVMDEPMLHAWMPGPAADGESGGRWVSEEMWPPLRPVAGDYALGDGTLALTPSPERAFELSSPESTGLDAGGWCPWTDADLAGDQGRDDDLSLAFTSEPLEECVEILGTPALTVEVSAEEARALLAVRLCDVAPDGSSRLVTRGLLNLTPPCGKRRPAAARARAARADPGSARGDRARVPGGASDPGRRELVVLAVGLALAEARGPHALHRARIALRAAGAPAGEARLASRRDSCRHRSRQRFTAAASAGSSTTAIRARLASRSRSSARVDDGTSRRARSRSRAPRPTSTGSRTATRFPRRSSAGAGWA